ncbi:MAG: hypothetical protein EBQ80_03565 [Proteobacteria bacterium]|nr:hypothetical protein [Pseudomonadota bacterium]
MEHKKQNRHFSSHIFMSTAIAAILLQSGCQTMPQQPMNSNYYNNNNHSINAQAMNQGQMQQSQMNQGQYQPYGYQPDYQNLAPAAGPLPMAQAPAYAAPASNGAAEAALIGLRDRLERVEKAMLRLDKRMQLVEKNELNRINGSTTPAYQFGQVEPAAQQAAATAPAASTPSEEQIAMQALNIGPADATPQGFRNVGTEDDGTIRSALQAAPRSLGGTQMASLADSAAVRSTSTAQAASDVAVWTVRYEPGKVWPDRAQLPASRDVVSALRTSKVVTLFARGANPQDKNFRERVKALSRYLAKVSSQENVPIAAMPSPQLDGETIEILATH